MSEWETWLSQAGYRLTSARRAVMQVLLESAVPLSPCEIFQRGQALHPPLGLVSVYRTLALLEQLALVRRIHHEECRGYVSASPGHRHTILCRGCGYAVEFPGSENLEDLVSRVQKSTGFQVEDHLLQFVGLCPTCQVQV